MNILSLSKKATVEALLKEEGSIFVQLDATKKGVRVPDYLSKEAHLSIQIGYNLAVQIYDLEIGDIGISATLSFNHSPFTCFVPWTAVYAVVTYSKESLCWPLATEVEEEPVVDTPKTVLTLVK